MRLCNFLQFGDATFSKNILQLLPKSACKKQYYHEKPHEGIAEYYKSLNHSIPTSGISPRQEWNRDAKPLVFLDAATVGKAFLHHEKREVDKGACLSFNGQKYEVSTALIGATVEISYDPMDPETLMVTYPGITPFEVHPLSITEYCDPKPEIPACMLPVEPESSRFLNSLEKQHEKNRQIRADALSFGNYRKEGMFIVKYKCRKLQTKNVGRCNYIL